MNKRLGNLLLFLGALLAFLPVAVPIYFIQPFREQHTRSLIFSLWLKEWALFISVAGFALALFAGISLWRSRIAPARWWKKAIIALALVFSGFFAFAARVNVYELMFHPMNGLRFVSAEYSGLGPAEMVLAVRVGGETRAYPVTYLAYHHIANDTVGGVPIAATY